MESGIRKVVRLPNTVSLAYQLSNCCLTLSVRLGPEAVQIALEIEPQLRRTLDAVSYRTLDAVSYRRTRSVTSRAVDQSVTSAAKPFVVLVCMARITGACRGTLSVDENGMLIVPACSIASNSKVPATVPV